MESIKIGESTYFEESGKYFAMDGFGKLAEVTPLTSAMIKEIISANEDGSGKEKTGFQFFDHDPFPMVEVRLNGHPLSIKQLCEVAEQMRLQLLEFGVVVQVKGRDDAKVD